MKKEKRTNGAKSSALRREIEVGTRVVASKNQGYTIPFWLYQELVDEATRRRRLGLPHSSQNAIAIAGITAWLEEHKGGE